MQNISNAEMSSDGDKEDKEFINESHEQKYNQIQDLTQPNTADEATEMDEIDEMDEPDEADVIEEEIGITNINTEQIHAVDLEVHTDTQIVPENEEIDMKAPEENHQMITPPPSNQGTPISANASHERTIKFSQLRHLSIGDPHPHSNHVFSVNQKSSGVQQGLFKGSSAPVSPISGKETAKRTKLIPAPMSLQFSRSPSEYAQNSSQQPLRAPVMSLPIEYENKIVCYTIRCIHDHLHNPHTAL